MEMSAETDHWQKAEWFLKAGIGRPNITHSLSQLFQDYTGTMSVKFRMAGVSFAEFCEH